MQSLPAVAGSSATTVNYSYHGIDASSSSTVNVYPIINVPGGVSPDQPIIVNVNVMVNK